MDLFVYSHKKDCDGIFSAAIMRRYMEKKGLTGRINFIDYGPVNEIRAIFEEMKKIPPKSTVVIVDFGNNEEMEAMQLDVFGTLKRNGSDIFWLDHHMWRNEFKTKLAGMVDLTVTATGDEFCGAELAYRKFMPDDEISSALAKLGRDSDIDMWKRKPPTPKYSLTVPVGNLITYYNYIAGDDYAKRRDMLLKIVEKVSSASLENLLEEDLTKPIFDEELQKDYTKYLAVSSEKLNECLKSTEIFKVNGYAAAVGRVEPLISSTEAGNSIIRRYGVDVAVVLSGKTGLSVRRNNDRSEIDCSEIAKMFNGGGHVFAAGGRLDFEINTDADVKRAKETVKSRVSDYLSKR